MGIPISHGDHRHRYFDAVEEVADADLREELSQYMAATKMYQAMYERAKKQVEDLRRDQKGTA